MIPLTTTDFRVAPLRAARRSGQLLGWAAFLGGALVILFWVAYLSGSIPLGQHDEIARAFEAAFPIADLAFAVALIAAGRALLERRRSGPFFLVVASSMSLYLGLLDATFYARHWAGRGGNAIQALLSGTCIAGGVVGLRAAWTLWRGR